MSIKRDKMANKDVLKLVVLCGGPSKERGISLNSARSVCDHLDGDQQDGYNVEVSLVYFSV